MEEWLHCNLCIKSAVEMQRGGSYFITDCGHLFCNQCVKRASPDCAVCQAQCSTAQLNDKLPGHILTYFKSPESILQEAQTINKKAEQVRRFQHAHRKRFQKALAEKSVQQNILLERMKQKLEQYKKENSEMKRFIASQSGMMSCSPGRMRSSSSPDHSPRSTPSSSPRRHSPNQQPFANKIPTPPMHYSSVQCTPTKSSIDASRHSNSIASLGRRASPNDKRLCIRSPPVQGKLYSPPTVFTQNVCGYRSKEGVASKVAKLGSPIDTHQVVNNRSPGLTQTSTPKISFNLSQFTPPNTPKLPFNVGTKLHTR